MSNKKAKDAKGNGAKTEDGNPDHMAAEHSDAAPNLPLVVLAQYVKDVSFENPHTPDSVRASRQRPEIKVNFVMDAEKLEDEDIQDFFEVTLTISVEAERDGKTVYIAEVHYGVAVSLGSVPEEQKHPLLLIEVPRLAFPFVREILCDVIVKGGHPPVLLQPVNFKNLYLQRFGGEQEKESAEGKPEKKKAKKVS